MNRRLCASLAASTLRGVRALASSLPPEIPLVELRMDRLGSREVAGGEWEALGRDPGREWVWTWRSPEEGGHSPRPPGLLRRAVEAGFPWIDVEARWLEAGDPEACDVPEPRRWVSRHDTLPPASPRMVGEGWDRLRRQPGALHKLVVPADRFAVNDWVLELLPRALSSGPATLFAQGWVGHPSRIAGYLGGNAVTFLAPDDGTPTATGQPTVEQALAMYSLPTSSSDMRLYGVLGNPAHPSRSPYLYNHAFRGCGERALYLWLESPEPGPVVHWVREGRLAGVSVTAPFKEEVLDELDQIEEPARTLGAVNTVWRDEGRLRGANTDLEAAQELLSLWENRTPVAVLGAGGSARAVLGATRALGLPATVFHRDPDRGKPLARELDVGWGGVWTRLDPRAFGVVVNCTPLRGPEEFSPPLAGDRWENTAILDLTYGSGPSGWEELARRNGSRYRGGLEFLTRQATGQLYRWTRQRLSAEDLEEGLRP